MKKIESIYEYQQLAARTCAILETPELDAFHMNMGIYTEVGEALASIKNHIAYGKELDLVNLAEEIGDIAWYIANRARIFCPEVQWTEESFSAIWESFHANFPSATGYIDVANIITSLCTEQGLSEISPEEYTGISDMVLLKAACVLLNLDFYQVLTTNIEKLSVRYPEKFTEEWANNRDLGAEREVLENVTSASPSNSTPETPYSEGTSRDEEA